MKTEIIANLKEFNNYHGMAFTSEEDSIEYYKGLVELIEKLITKHSIQVPTGSTWSISESQLTDVVHEIVSSLGIVSDAEKDDNATIAIEKERIVRLMYSTFSRQ